MQTTIYRTKQDVAIQLVETADNTHDITVPRGTAIERTPLLGGTIEPFFVKDFSFIPDTQVRALAQSRGIIIPESSAEIIAMQWEASEASEACWSAITAFCSEINPGLTGASQIILRGESDTVVSEGDWIVKGNDGEYFACKADQFSG